MELELPYKAEYSKSARAKCRGCKETIAKEVLRIAVYVQVIHRYTYSISFVILHIFLNLFIVHYSGMFPLVKYTRCV